MNQQAVALARFGGDGFGRSGLGRLGRHVDLQRRLGPGFLLDRGRNFGAGLDRCLGALRVGPALALVLCVRAQMENRRQSRTGPLRLPENVNVLSPQLVLISGEGPQAWPHMATAFHRGLNEAVFPPLRDVAVELDPWDDGKWALGAAALVLRATFVTGLDQQSSDDSVRARLERVAAL